MVNEGPSGSAVYQCSDRCPSSSVSSLEFNLKEEGGAMGIQRCNDWLGRDLVFLFWMALGGGIFGCGFQFRFCSGGDIFYFVYGQYTEPIASRQLGHTCHRLLYQKSSSLSTSARAAASDASFVASIVWRRSSFFSIVMCRTSNRHGHSALMWPGLPQR